MSERVRRIEMKSFFFVLILVVLVLPLLGYLPKVSYETITTYEDHGVFSTKGSKVSGVSIEAESYDLSEVLCECGPVCFYYYRVLKHEKAKRPLSEDAEDWLRKNLVADPVFRKPGASGQGADAYDFVCGCLKMLNEYRFEIGRLFAEYRECGVDVARLKPVCDEYNKVAGSKLWKKIYAARGQVLERQKPDLQGLLLKRPHWRTGREYYHMKMANKQSNIMNAIEESYGCLIDLKLKNGRGDDSENEDVKKAKKEARRARKLAEEANETAIAAKIQAQRAAQNSGECSAGYYTIPAGNGKARLIGGGGSTGVKVK